MNNYIEVQEQPIQNTPPNQPDRAEKQSRTKILMISALVLLGLLSLAGLWFAGKQAAPESLVLETMDADTQPKDEIVVTGVIRSSGLSTEERQANGLLDANFQVTQLSAPNAGYQGYYLMTDAADSAYGDNEISPLQGKCVSVQGVLKNNPVGQAIEYFERAALIPASLEVLDYSDCGPYPETPPADDTSAEKITLRGVLVHADRPATDIGYDYMLQLSESYLDTTSAMSDSEMLDEISIAPNSNAQWIEIENLIGTEVEAEGSVQWGYAESKYFRIISLRPIPAAN